MKCTRCGREYELDLRRVLCDCGGLLEIVLDTAGVELGWGELRKRRAGLWKYRELIPLPPGLEPVSMGEGGTPLVHARRLSEKLGVEVYVKLEGSNPTGSFKDRGMTVAVSVARHLGVGGVVCASTGNTAASMSAYARRAGLEPFLVLPRGGVARGKLAQVALYGATVVFVDGGFDEALRAVMEAHRLNLAYPLNSFNPWRIEGQKTISYEIAEDVGVPDWVAYPVGNAGNITAGWKGFKELYGLGLVDSTPRMLGVQAEGASPLVRAFESGREGFDPVSEPRTIASAIRIGNPVSGERALRVVRESSGSFLSVSDSEILEAQRLLARLEGIGVEPASAAAVAGVVKAVSHGVIGRGERVVVVATGHALKDPDVASSHEFRSLSARDAEHAVRILSEVLGGRTW